MRSLVDFRGDALAARDLGPRRALRDSGARQPDAAVPADGADTGAPAGLEICAMCGWIRISEPTTMAVRYPEIEDAWLSDATESDHAVPDRGPGRAGLVPRNHSRGSTCRLGVPVPMRGQSYSHRSG